MVIPPRGKMSGAVPGGRRSAGEKALGSASRIPAPPCAQAPSAGRVTRPTPRHLPPAWRQSVESPSRSAARGPETTFPELAPTSAETSAAAACPAAAPTPAAGRASPARPAPLEARPAPGPARPRPPAQPVPEEPHLGRQSKAALLPVPLQPTVPPRPETAPESIPDCSRLRSRTGSES